MILFKCSWCIGVFMLQMQEQVSSLNKEIAVLKDANEKLVSRYICFTAFYKFTLF